MEGQLVPPIPLPRACRQGSMTIRTRQRSSSVLLVLLLIFVPVCLFYSKNGIVEARSSSTDLPLRTTAAAAATKRSSTSRNLIRTANEIRGGGDLDARSSTRVVGANTKNASTSKNIGNESKSSPARFKVLLLLLMVLQNSSSVLVARHTRTNIPKDQLYVVNHLILMTEATKFVLACGLESRRTGGKLWQSLQIHIGQRPQDMVAIVIPSVLYVMQNSLVVVALSNLSAPLFQVAYQCKLLTTALVSCLFLGRRYSIQQWICLASLGLGVAIVVLGETTTTTQTTAPSSLFSNNMILGLTAVMIGCISSAFAGVGLEIVLKNKPLVPPKKEYDESTSSFTTATEKEPASLWMRNIQMAGISVLIALIQNGLTHISSNNSNGNTNDVRKLFLHGFHGWVWVLVLLQAGGGMLVAAVIKYADNVLKGLATGVSVVVATAASMVLFHTPLTRPFIMGATLILASVYLFSNPIISI